MTNNTTTDMSKYMAVTQDGEQVLGKMLYYSLPSILVERQAMVDLCQTLGFPFNPSKRTSPGDAFRSATGDIYQRFVDSGGGYPQIYKIYCCDNRLTDEQISRELVLEEVNQATNRYTKLANIFLDKRTGQFGYDNVAYHHLVDPEVYCLQAKELFEQYQDCYGQRHIDTMLGNYIDMMQGVKAVNRGKLYFVPRTQMHQISLFEDLVAMLQQHNLHRNRDLYPCTVNSMYVVDDAKQREKMAAAFYQSARREIEEYQERANHLLQSGSQSARIMHRWVVKIDALEQKKRDYERVLNAELSKLDDDFSTLRMLSTELQIRARGLEILQDKQAA